MRKTIIQASTSGAIGFTLAVLGVPIPLAIVAIIVWAPVIVALTNRRNNA